MSALDVVFLVLGVAGAIALPLSVALYFRSKRDVRVRAIIRNRSVVDPGSEGAIEIRLDGQEVPRVSVATIDVWNAGRGAFTAAAMAPTDPLAVELGDGGRVLAVARGANCDRFDVAVELVRRDGGDRVELLPQFLNRGDQFRVEVTHTAKEDAPVELKGTVIGGGPVARFKDRRSDGMSAMFVAVLFGFGVLFFLAPVEDSSWSELELSIRLLLALAVIAVGVPTVWLTRRLSRRWERGGVRRSRYEQRAEPALFPLEQDSVAQAPVGCDLVRSVRGTATPAVSRLLSGERDRDRHTFETLNCRVVDTSGLARRPVAVAAASASNVAHREHLVVS